MKLHQVLVEDMTLIRSPRLCQNGTNEMKDRFDK